MRFKQTMSETIADRGNEIQTSQATQCHRDNLDSRTDGWNTETDEASVIARGRACVRTEQYRHSEVMRSVGRSHIQRCVRAAAAQAMYDHATTAPRAGGLWRRRRRAGRRPARTSQGISWPTPGTPPASGRACTGSATTQQSLTEALTIRRCWPNKHNTVRSVLPSTVVYSRVLMNIVR